MLVTKIGPGPVPSLAEGVRDRFDPRIDAAANYLGPGARIFTDNLVLGEWDHAKEADAVAAVRQALDQAGPGVVANVRDAVFIGAGPAHRESLVGNLFPGLRTGTAACLDRSAAFLPFAESSLETVMPRLNLRSFVCGDYMDVNALRKAFEGMPDAPYTSVVTLFGVVHSQKTITGVFERIQRALPPGKRILVIPEWWPVTTDALLKARYNVPKFLKNAQVGIRELTDAPVDRGDFQDTYTRSTDPNQGAQQYHYRWYPPADLDEITIGLRNGGVLPEAKRGEPTHITEPVTQAARRLGYGISNSARYLDDQFAGQMSDMGLEVVATGYWGAEGIVAALMEGKSAFGRAA